MAQITKNGKAYDSADVIITLLGNVPNEVYDLKYGSSDEHQLNYTIGSKEANSWSQGKRSHEGTITIGMADQVAIEQAAKKSGYKTLMDVPPFDLIVNFLNAYNQEVTDVITCKFMNNGREIGGDMALRYQFNLFVLSINYSKE